MVEIAKKYFKEKGMEKYTCCICGCEFYDFTGCNPWPVVEDEEAVCCHRCDNIFVQNARLGNAPGELVFASIPISCIPVREC